MPIARVTFNAEETMDLARVFLNDQNVQLWDDNLLMPMLYQAHLELQNKLRMRAAPVMKGFLGLTIPAFQFALLNPPTDMTAPIQIWEKPTGASSESFQLVTETDVLPLLAPTTNNLVYWAWMEESIMFAGAILDTDVFIIYWRRIPIPTSTSDSIGIIDGELYLAPRIAAIAAASVGEENTSSVMAAQALASLTEIMQANRGRAPQNVGTSVRP